MIYMALANNGLVLAIFPTSFEASNFCRANDACMVPFNAAMHSAPEVGSVYAA